MAHRGGGQSAGQGRRNAAGGARIGLGALTIAGATAAVLLLTWQDPTEAPVTDAGTLPSRPSPSPRPLSRSRRRILKVWA